ncbi:hypothetical protein GW952_32215 (plasmid) [Klebsiella michiganensis]|uniref:Uncharacterized protein n=1 Tax=Klebsiella michiganensis TaxID=1134687 RepID=A0A6P1V7G1_9ENTR|nr:hypothetical protein [Klebsiella michiganensis]QHS50248.1 hypothetical protein GW952_32215 [Klebsiella michiganensis]
MNKTLRRFYASEAKNNDNLTENVFAVHRLEHGVFMGAAMPDIMSYVISFKNTFPLSGVSKAVVYINAVIVTGVLLAWRMGFIKNCKI